jgi:hypothetical protein
MCGLGWNGQGGEPAVLVRLLVHGQSCNACIVTIQFSIPSVHSVVCDKSPWSARQCLCRNYSSYIPSALRQNQRCDTQPALDQNHRSERPSVNQTSVATGFQMEIASEGRHVIGPLRGIRSVQFSSVQFSDHFSSHQIRVSDGNSK